MHDGDPVTCTEVKNALKINIVMAKALVNEALALHPRKEEDQFLPASRSPPQPKPFAAFPEKLAGTKSHTFTESELKRWLELGWSAFSALSTVKAMFSVPFCVSSVSTLALPWHGRCCLIVIIVEVVILNAQVSKRLQRQQSLAAIIMPSLPKLIIG